MIFLFVKKLVCIFKCFFGIYFYFTFSRFYLILLISLEFYVQNAVFQSLDMNRSQPLLQN